MSYIQATNQIVVPTKEDSFIFSPHSCMSVMILFYAGTSGKTRKAIKKRFGLPTINTTLTELVKLNSKLNELKQFNMLLVRKDMVDDLDPDFVKQISTIGSIDKFSAEKAESTVKKVNKLVDSTTNHLIKEILSNDSITSETVSIFLNCVYFKMRWSQVFDKKNTTLEPFYSEPSKKLKDVEMMTMCGKKFKYSINKKFQLLEMNYVGNEFTFGVVLPKTHGVIATHEEIAELISKLKSEKITQLSIPKFKQETTVNIKNDMFQGFDWESLEMQNMFLSERNDFKVDEFIQKAIIIVDEEGTEAAATTRMSTKNCIEKEEEEINFIADHAFSYYIRHIKTDVIIFTGLFM